MSLENSNILEENISTSSSSSSSYFEEQTRISTSEATIDDSDTVPSDEMFSDWEGSAASFVVVVILLFLLSFFKAYKYKKMEKKYIKMIYTSLSNNVTSSIKISNVTPSNSANSSNNSYFNTKENNTVLSRSLASSLLSPSTPIDGNPINNENTPNWYNFSTPVRGRRKSFFQSNSFNVEKNAVEGSTIQSPTTQTTSTTQSNISDTNIQNQIKDYNYVRFEDVDKKNEKPKFSFKNYILNYFKDETQIENPYSSPSSSTTNNYISNSMEPKIIVSDSNISSPEFDIERNDPQIDCGSKPSLSVSTTTPPPPLPSNLLSIIFYPKTVLSPSSISNQTINSTLSNNTTNNTSSPNVLLPSLSSSPLLDNIDSSYQYEHNDDDDNNNNDNDDDNESQTSIEETGLCMAP